MRPSMGATVSPVIIRETAKVLRRDFAWRDDRVQRAIRVVAQTARIVVTRSVLSVVTADPDDDRILECALDGKVDIIVSNDHHLLDVKIYAAIPIMAGVDFRRTLGLK
jgi:predicted nucleic acid-binding protein